MASDDNISRLEEAFDFPLHYRSDTLSFPLVSDFRDQATGNFKCAKTSFLNDAHSSALSRVKAEL